MTSDLIERGETWAQQFSSGELRTMSMLFHPIGEIALIQRKSESTVRGHIYGALKKTGVKGIVQLAVDAAQNEVLDIDTIPQGRTEALNSRETNVLQAHYGDSYKEAAIALGISWKTVAVHWRHIFQKSDIVTRRQAPLLALADGLPINR